MDEEDEMIEPTEENIVEQTLEEGHEDTEKLEPSPEDLIGFWQWANQPKTFEGVTKDIPLANLEKKSLWLVNELLSLGFIYGEYGATDAENYFSTEAQITANVSVSKNALARRQITTLRHEQDITMRRKKKRKLGLPWK